MVSVAKDLNKHMDLKVIPGVEITHAPILMIDDLASKAKQLGAQMVVVHGESLVETVRPKTNLAAVSCKMVDILAHPGLLTEEEGELAEKNKIYLELSARQGHCLGNGLVAGIATKTGAKMLLNTDLHQPEELLTQDQAFHLAIGAGLDRDVAIKVVRDYPRELVGRTTEDTV
jgi:putative hydrolase